MSAQRERGSVAVVIIIIAALVILGAGGYGLFGGGSQSVTPGAPTARGQAPSTVAVDSGDSLDSLDGVVYAGFFGLYYRTYTPAPAPSYTSGAPETKKPAVSNSKKGEFKKIAGADPATFSEIKTIPMTSIPNPAAVGQEVTTTVTYYHDNDEVFVAQSTVYPSGDTVTSVEPVAADPSTFQILNDTYAKDADHVYVVSWVCEGETCTLVLVIVEGADSATFHVIEETIIQQSDGNGTVTADAIDGTHVFNDGVIVDTIITPGSDDSDMTPVLISP